MMFGRIVRGKNARFEIIADLDGDVRGSFLFVDAEKCEAMDVAFRDNKYMVVMAGDGRTQKAEGWIAGDVAEMYPVAISTRPSDGFVYSAVDVSDGLLVRRLGSVFASGWSGGERVVYDGDYGYSRYAFAIGRDLIIEVGGPGYNGVVSWSEKEGVRPLLRWVEQSSTRAVGNFGTDGVDMVWTYSERDSDSPDAVIRSSIMTAPFSTDPVETQARARRLRSDLTTSTAYQYGVGCGYAARAVPAAGRSDGTLMIVRLSDGASWILPRPEGAVYGVTHAFGVTCDVDGANVEVLAEIVGMNDWEGGGYPEYVRIRVDSLGEPLPAD